MKQGRSTWWVTALLVVSLVLPFLPATAHAEENIVIVPLEKERAGNYIQVNDIKAKFPQYDWTDPSLKFYVTIPAGQYKHVRIGGLPDRRGKSPVIITNTGGQVRIGGTGLPESDWSDNTLWISGGANWKITGEYNAANGTGNANFTGHQNGNYANSSGHYGIEIKDAKIFGIKISETTDFEMSFIEISKTGFAGMAVKTDFQPSPPMENVSIHDMYVHDTKDEGMYIGHTNDVAANQHKFINLQVFNNRIVRTGAEGLQISHMGDGSRVHHNVILMSALGWKSPFQHYQNFGMQIVARDGDMEIDHNILIGAAGNLFNIRFVATAAERSNPPGEVDVHHNYFSHSRGDFSYLFEPKSGASNNNLTSKLLFRDNMVKHLDYQLSEAINKNVNNNNVFNNINVNAVNPFVFSNNKYEGPQQFIIWQDDPNKRLPNVTDTGNQRTTIAPVQFMDSTFAPGFDYLKVENWFPKLLSTDVYVQDMYNKDIYYKSGDYVMYVGKMYKCLLDHNGQQYTPGSAPSVWQEVPVMTDDLRLDPNSPHQGIGLLDMPGGNPSHTLQLIVPTDAGAAVGSPPFPMNYAFDGNVAYNASTGELSGGSTGELAPYYANRYGYIDFGPNWANVRIAETWTYYRAWSHDDSKPYVELWWDSNKDTVNDSGLSETSINFNTALNLNTLGSEKWILDGRYMNPITPKARYLILKSPTVTTQRALEYAILGWMEN